MYKDIYNEVWTYSRLRKELHISKKVWIQIPNRKRIFLMTDYLQYQRNSTLGRFKMTMGAILVGVAIHQKLIKNKIDEKKFK